MVTIDRWFFYVCQSPTQSVSMEQRGHASGVPPIWSRSARRFRHRVSAKLINAGRIWIDYPDPSHARLLRPALSEPKILSHSLLGVLSQAHRTFPNKDHRRLRDPSEAKQGESLKRGRYSVSTVSSDSERKGQSILA